MPIFNKKNAKIKELEEENSRLKKELKALRYEMDDHLSAINENTNEIQNNYEVLCKAESKFEKLAERMDELALSLEKRSKIEQFTVQELTKHEQEVFLALYILSDNLESVSYENIARRICIPEESVAKYVSVLIQKGIPIYRKFVDNKALLTLDSEFKSHQAKHNIVAIDPSVSKALS